MKEGQQKLMRTKKNQTHKQRFQHLTYALYYQICLPSLLFHHKSQDTEVMYYVKENHLDAFTPDEYAFLRTLKSTTEHSGMARVKVTAVKFVCECH